MKITVGMGSIDEYIPYVEAGADEVFIGYVPPYLLHRYENLPSVNRREVLYSNVQIGARSELQILAKMVKKVGVPVSITLNSLYYPVSMLPFLKQMILECIEDGFDTFIIADVHLLSYLKKEGILPKIKVHISGELGEMNSFVLQYLEEYEPERIIFHRKVSLSNMEKMMEKNLEYEAFVLNENCHFHGGYCQSLHCDGLHHMCLVPYKMEKEVQEVETSIDCLGKSGCGICALYKLSKMGIQYGKLVSRGNFMEETIEDIMELKRALRLVEESNSEEEYVKKVKKELFEKGCSMQCYYRD